jgi:predicted DNA binding CopG/RHH family protein
MKPSSADKLKSTTIRLPDELLKRAKVHAVQAGTTLQQLIIEGLEARLSARRTPRRESGK